MQLGAPLNLVDTTSNMSALAWAGYLDHSLVCKLLLRGKYKGRGANINLQGADGQTPLMDASMLGHFDVLRLLLSRGADQGLQSDDGSTALHLAVASGDAAVVKRLCTAAGAAVALARRDAGGRTPLVLAVDIEDAACEAVLREHGAAV